MSYPWEALLNPNYFDPRVQHPKINDHLLRKFIIFGGDPENFLIHLRRAGIDHNEHKRVVDLGAGDGGIAHLLVTKEGFSPQQITCIDEAKPNPPMAEGCLWKFLDLLSFAQHLEKHPMPELPQEIRDMRGAFDFATSHYLNFYTVDLYYIANFLLKPGGIFYVEPDFTSARYKWERLTYRGEEIDNFFVKR